MNLFKRIFLLSLTCLLVISCTVNLTFCEENRNSTKLSEIFTTIDLDSASIDDLLQAMQEGKLTSSQLVSMYLDRIEAYNDTFNAVVLINQDALKQAQQIDQRRANGEKLGKLAGIPFVVKDNIDVYGFPTTMGADIYRDNYPEEDSEVVKILKQEDAIFLGKTNLSTYCLDGSRSESQVYGTTYNAYDPSRTPAGSSGGSAVAVALKFAAFALGTDTESSLRRPASFANIYALRPSFGMLSQQGVMLLNPNYDTVGPMCKNIVDLIKIESILSGIDYQKCKKEGGLKGKRIGYLTNSFSFYDYQQMSVDVQNLVTQFTKVLVDNGAILVDLSKILDEDTIDYYASDYSKYGCLIFREFLDEIFKENDIDAILYISQTDVAQKAQEADDTYNNYACYINVFSPMAGVPEINIPMGFVDTYDYPLPLGASLFGSYGNDELLLEIAYAYQAHSDSLHNSIFAPTLSDEDLDSNVLEMLTSIRNYDGCFHSSKEYAQILNECDSLQAKVGDVSQDYLMAAVDLANDYDLFLQKKIPLVAYFLLIGGNILLLFVLFISFKHRKRHKECH